MFLKMIIKIWTSGHYLCTCIWRWEGQPVTQRTTLSELRHTLCGNLFTYELKYIELWLGLSRYTEYHRQGGWNNRYLFLIVLKGRRCKIKVLAYFVLVRALFLVYRWLPSCCVSTWLKKWALLSLPIRTLSHHGPTLMTSPKPNHFYFLVPSHWELEFQHMIFEGTQTCNT